jgi:hypothetical protein
MSSQLGISSGVFRNFHKRSTERAQLILSGDNSGYKLIDSDQVRSKFSIVQQEAFKIWIVSHCDLVKQNPLKNKMVWMRDRKGKVICDMDNKPACVQKMLLMASYWELQNYMIDYYPGMVIQDDKILFSEPTLQAIMPKHIKKAGD